MNCDKDLPVIKQRLSDQAQQLIRSQISASPKCTYYRYLIDVYSLQYYLSKFILVHLRKCITKFRFSSHNLAIETGTVDILLLTVLKEHVFLVQMKLKMNTILYLFAHYITV